MRGEVSGWKDVLMLDQFLDCCFGSKGEYAQLFSLADKISTKMEGTKLKSRYRKYKHTFYYI